MDMAVKHDAELGAAWLRQLRGEAPPRLSAFPLAVSFMLAGIQRFEQPVTGAPCLAGAVQAAEEGSQRQARHCLHLPGQPDLPEFLRQHPHPLLISVYLPAACPPACPPACLPARLPADALKSLVLNAYKDAAVLAGSPWLQQPEPGHSAAPSCGAGQAAALRAALLQCARNSGAGQGGIVQPMVALAVGLIESGGGHAGSGGGGGSRGAAECDDASEEESAAASSAPPAQRAAALGARLLLELFQAARHELRRDIVCLCHNRLIGAKVCVCVSGWLAGWPAAPGSHSARHLSEHRASRQQQQQLTRSVEASNILFSPCLLQEEVAAPYVRLLALLVRRNQATIGGERDSCLPVSARLPVWLALPASQPDP